MEDAATAEISRSQLWQWLHFSSKLSDGRPMTRELYQQLVREEIQQIQMNEKTKYLDHAVSLLNSLVLSPEFAEFLTLKAYETLNQINQLAPLQGGQNATEHTRTSPTA
jgi:malate synthase